MLFDAETVMAAQVVVTRRVPIMWSDFIAPTPQSRREMDRMVTEKFVAAGQGSAMMPGALMAASFSMFGACQRGVPMPLAVLSGFEKMARTVLSPAGRAVRANARRLSA